MVVGGFQGIKDTIDNIKKIKGTTGETNTSSQLDQNTKITTPTLESGNLFNSTQQPSLNGFSGTVQTGVSIPQTNVFETGSIPSKEAYVIAKNTGGSLLENQRTTLRETANKILNSVGLAVGNSVAGQKGVDWLNQKWASGRTKGWGQEIGGVIDFASNLGDIGGTLLTKADTKLTQGLDKLFGTEKGYTKESEAERIEGVKSIGKKVRGLPGKAQENYWGEIPEKEGVLGWMGDVAEQAGQMEAPILSSFLLGGGKKTMVATMFPVMYEESYDRFSQIEGATDEEVVLASTISALVKSIIEVAFGFENIITGGKSKALSKLLEKPILNFIKQMGLGVAGESVVEEPLQAITDDIGAYLLGEESEYETLWSMLFSPDYWGYLVKDIMLPTARVTRPLVGISTHYALTAEKGKKKAIDKTLEDYDKAINEGLKGYDTILTDDLENTMDKVFRRDDAYINLARVEDNYDEFVADAREMNENISDEYLKSIWDYANKYPASKIEVRLIDLYIRRLNEIDNLITDIDKDLGQLGTEIEGQKVESNYQKKLDNLRNSIKKQLRGLKYDIDNFDWEYQAELDRINDYDDRIETILEDEEEGEYMGLNEETKKKLIKLKGLIGGQGSLGQFMSKLNKRENVEKTIKDELNKLGYGVGLEDIINEISSELQWLELDDIYEERKEEYAYKYPEAYQAMVNGKENEEFEKYISEKLQNEGFNEYIKSELNKLGKSVEIQDIIDSTDNELFELEMDDIYEEWKEEYAYKYPEYTSAVSELDDLDEDIEEDIRDEEYAYKYPEAYQAMVDQEENEGIPEIEDTGNYEVAVDNEIQEGIDTNVDYLMEFSKEMEEQFDRELAQDTNKTVKELKEQSQRTISDIKINSLVNETNETLQYLATEIDIDNLDEVSLFNNTPKFAFGRYQKPEGMVMSTIGKKGEGISSKATRNETEREYYKTRESLDMARRQANALGALIKRFNSSLNKSQKASPEDIKAVEDAMGGRLIGKEILLRDLENGKLVDAIFKAYKMIDTWGGTIKKLKAKANREAWKYVYRLNAESKDNDLIGFSTFVLKHKLKTRPTDAKDKAMIKNALYKMSEIFNIDMAKVFEGCNIIFLDYNGSSKKNAWGSMEGFIDGNGTPVIPISLNYMGWKESTVIHELIHGLDFVYQYRNGGVSFIENDSLFYSANFLYTLNREFPSLYKKLVNEMTPGDGKKIGYWTKPTEVMSRIFQEYYEYYVLNDKETVEDPYHWKDITLVKNSVNKLLDLFRKEFGISPVLNGNETVEEYNKKIDESVDKFNSDDTWQFMEMINKVGTEMKLLRLKTDITKETEGNRGEDYLNNLISLAEYEFQWGMLMEQGQNYTDVLIGTKEGIYETFGPAREYEEKVNEEIQDTMKEIEEGKYINISDDTKKKISKEKAKDKIKETLGQIVTAYKYIFEDITERLKLISPEIAGSLVRMEAQTGITASIYNHKVKGFIDKYDKLSKKNQDVLHKLLFNYIEDINKDRKIQEGVLLEFARENGMEEELKDVFDVLNAIKEDYKASGLKLTERELYFPRTVSNYKGLIKYLRKKLEEGKGNVDYKLRKDLVDELDNVVKQDKLSDMEKNRRIRNILEELSGRFSPKRVASDSTHQKKRDITTTEDWGDEILEYYDKPDVSLAKYIANMVSNVEQAKFFARGIGTEALEEIYSYITEQGVQLTDNMKEIVREYMNGKDVKVIINEMLKDVLGNNLFTEDMAIEITADILKKISDVYGANTEEAVTALVNKKRLEGMTEEQVEEVKSILNSYFNRRSTPAIAQLIKNFGYLFNLTQYTSTIRQLGDIAFSVLRDPTLVKSVINTVLKRSGINVDTLGLEDLYEDLKQDRANLTTWLLEKELTLSGFKAVDLSMKDLFLNSALVNMNRLANNEKKSGALKKRLITVWGEKVGEEVFNIYKSGELPKSEYGGLDVYQAMNVLVDLAYQLGECQPIYRGNMTQLYLDVPRLRPIYGLRTFTLKIYNLIVNGTKQVFKNSREMGNSIATSSLKAGWFAGTSLFVISFFDTIVQDVIDLFFSIFYGMAGNDNKRWEDTLMYSLMHSGPRETVHKLWRNMLNTAKSTLLMGDVVESRFKREGLQSLFNIAPPAVGFFNDLLGSLNWTIDMVAGEEAVWDIRHPVEALDDDKEGKGWVYNPVVLVKYIPFIGKGIYEGFGLKDYASEHKRPRENKSSGSKGKSKTNTTSDGTPML